MSQPRRSRASRLGFIGFRVYIGSGFSVRGLGFGIQDLGLGVIGGRNWEIKTLVRVFQELFLPVEWGR